MQEKFRIFKSSWCYSRFLIHFSIRKKWSILCLRIPVLQSKQVILIRSTPTYLRCIADQTRSKYDQPSLYRRPSRCTPAQHTTCGERDHPRPFFNRLKNLSRSPRPLRAGPTNPRCMLDQHTLSPIKARSLPIRPFFQSGRERGFIGSLVWTGLYKLTVILHVSLLSDIFETVPRNTWYRNPLLVKDWGCSTLHLRTDPMHSVLGYISFKFEILH